MAEAVSIPVQALVDEFLTSKGKEVIKKMFYGFPSANAVRKFDGVTDKLILAEQDVAIDLIKEFNPTISFTNDAIVVRERRLTVAQVKTELKFVIRDETMRAYKAYLKGAGLVSTDLGLIDYLIMQPIEKQMQEMEDAMWQGEESSSGIGTRALIDRVDGYEVIARDAVTAGDATEVSVVAFTSSNAVSQVEAFYRAADKTMRARGMHIFCSYALFELYQQNLLTLHAQSDMTLQKVAGQGYTLEGMPLRIGANRSFLVPVPGLADANLLIGTRAEFLAYGFDYESEWTQWQIQQQGWETWALNAFPIGFQILLQKEGFLLVSSAV